MAENRINSPRYTLAAPIDAVATSLTLNESGASIPTTGLTRLTLSNAAGNQEIVTATGRAGSVLSGLTRAAESAADFPARAWAAGDFVEATLTLAGLNDALASTNPMTAQDDLIVGGAAGVRTRLAKGTDGQVLTVDPTTHHLVWATPAAGGGGMTNPMTTTGDMIRATGSGIPVRLPFGTEGQVLTVSPLGQPTWTNPALVNPMTAAGDLIVGGAGGAFTRLAKGADGQVLTVDPTTHLLVWATSPSGFADPLTTKGDLIVRGASATGRMGVGTDGQVLTADAASTNGLHWATPSSGGGGGSSGGTSAVPITLVPPPTVASLTGDNVAGASTNEDYGLYVESPANAGQNVRSWAQAIPATPYQFTVAFHPNWGYDGYPESGIVLRDGSGKLVCWGGRNYSNDGTLQFIAKKMTTATALSAEYGTRGAQYARGPGALIWLRVEDDGTTCLFRWSLDGRHWQTQFSRGHADFLTATQIGVYVNPNTSNFATGAWFLHWTTAANPSLGVGSGGGGGGSGLYDAYVHVRDERASGTNGGDYTTGGTWQTRPLQTEKSDVAGIATLGSNQITLAAGTYHVQARGATQFSGPARLRLRDITNGATLVLGDSSGDNQGSGGYTQNDPLELSGRFTLAATTVLELQMWAAFSRATYGLGAATSTGDVEVFASVELWREGTGGGAGGGGVSAGPYSSRPAAGTAGAAYIPDDSPFTYVDTGAAWAAYLSGIGKVTLPPNAAAWSGSNLSPAVLANSKDCVTLTTTTADGNLHVAYIAAPATPWVLEIGLQWLAPGNNYSGFGIALSDASNKFILWYGGNGDGLEALRYDRWSSFSAFDTRIVNTYEWVSRQVALFRIADDGTNLTFSVMRDFSGDRIDLLSEGRGAYLTGGPTRIGWFSKGLTTFPTQAKLVHWKVG